MNSYGTIKYNGCFEVNACLVLLDIQDVLHYFTKCMAHVLKVSHNVATTYIRQRNSAMK